MVLIEDLAHSAGAQYADGREVGTVGDITMLSFGRDKAIDSVNGGALVVRNHDASLAFPVITPSFSVQFRDRVYPLIAWLTRALYPIKLGRYVMGASIKLGLVVRSADGDVDETATLPHWQAKLARGQVTSLTTTAVRRRQKAQEYAKLIEGSLPSGMGQAGEAPVRVPLIVSNRDEVVKHLAAHGVQANDIWYDVPVSPQRLYDRVDYPVGECPNAVRIAEQLVNLPTHERISIDDIKRISQLVNEVAEA
jgi:dTDP-4-amino-4,6-dideoxygalactose transaminase